jgi:ribosome-binding protein aMBF1 (putative translation factor)
MLEARPPSVAAGDGQQAGPAVSAEPERADQLAADVARAVRDLRADAGLSERAAARLLGTSQTQLRRMEDPRYLPSLRSLARLAAAYGHRLRIAFEPKDRAAKAAAKPPAPRRVPAARSKRSAASRPARAAGRSGRRS